MYAVRHVGIAARTEILLLQVWPQALHAVNWCRLILLAVIAFHSLRLALVAKPCTSPKFCLLCIRLWFFLLLEHVSTSDVCLIFLAVLGRDDGAQGAAAFARLHDGGRGRSWRRPLAALLASLFAGRFRDGSVKINR